MLHTWSWYHCNVWSNIPWVLFNSHQFLVYTSSFHLFSKYLYNQWWYVAVLFWLKHINWPPLLSTFTVLGMVSDTLKIENNISNTVWAPVYFTVYTVQHFCFCLKLLQKQSTLNVLNHKVALLLNDKIFLNSFIRLLDMMETHFTKMLTARSIFKFSPSHFACIMINHCCS